MAHQKSQFITMACADQCIGLLGLSEVGCFMVAPWTCDYLHCARADRNNCFFNDPNVDWKGGLSTDRGSGVVTFSSEVHRKIRLYRQQADDVDNNGHGTHTVASLLGSPFDIISTKNLDYRYKTMSCSAQFCSSCSLLDHDTCLIGCTALQNVSVTVLDQALLCGSKAISELALTLSLSHHL